MTLAAHNTPHRRSTSPRLLIIEFVLTGGTLLTAVAMSTKWILHLPVIYVLATFALYTAMTVVVVVARPSVSRGIGIGPANRITLGRATLTLPLAPIVLYPLALTPTGLWWIISLASAVMILDGLDGWTARRTETSTPFGARFDMELDTILMLILSLLVWRSAKVGSWVVMIGVMRYLFVGSAYVWPWLHTELPPSIRRKTVCVVQDVALLVCLGPIVPSSLAVLAATTGLSTLVYSFGVDVRWLYTHSRTPSPRET